MILITGGMGFIGLHTARCLLDAGERLVLTRYRVSREPQFLHDELGKRVFVESLDVADQEAVQALFSRYPIDGVVHLAVPALRGVEVSDEFRVNLQGLLNVLDAARRAGVRRVSLASSVAVYAGLPSGPFSEEAPLRLESTNSTEAFKKTFAVLGLHYGTLTGMDVVALRIAGIYGPLYHSMANLPSRLTHAAVHGRQPDLAGGRGGVPYAEDEFDGCYVKDCARAIQMVQQAPLLNHRVYNVGAGRATRNGDLVDSVNAAVPGTNLAIPAGHGPQPRPHAYMEIGRLRADTGFESAYDVHSAIADYVEWLRNHPE
ncbi:MAG TPA: NAD(P)-dependent oxidoreductase [Dehalococcoidia bacterium]|nr:NAD(P)-dependent oxidoreductase [Dehalococcoidia bacterium]